MKLSKQKQMLINLTIISISLIVWIALLFNPGGIMTVEHCHVSDSGPSGASLGMLLEMNPVSSQLLGWGLMVVAMMLPKLTFPIQHIYSSSLKRYRFPLSLLFTSGYITVWMAVGIAMIAIILGLHLLMPGSYLPAAIVGFIAIVWQFSPIKQQCLNRGHLHSVLPAFGWPAYRAAFHFGIMHGVWCVGSGWAIMLFPMLLPKGHNLAMIIVTFIMLSEHFEHPRIPRWRIDFRTKLFRITLGQVQLLWKPLTGRNLKPSQTASN
jgi:predicted metal-binding membrane protein